MTTSPQSIVNYDIELVKNQAIEHLTERRSVVNLNELFEASLKLNCGHVDLPLLKQAIANDPNLIRACKEFTTRAILQEELNLIAMVRSGKNKEIPLVPNFEPSLQLGQDQRTALKIVLRSHDQITGIRGLAGTGKTTSLKEFNRAICGQGWEPIFCAPTGGAADLLAKDGFSNVSTLASLVLKNQLPAKSVVIVDEAGLVGNKDMIKLIQLAQASNARVLLVGDTKQHNSVPRGDALRILEQYSGFDFGTLSQIRRQKSKLFEEVASYASKHQCGKAFNLLIEMNQVIEEQDVRKLYEKVSSDYTESQKQGRISLVISPIWAEIRDVTEAIRLKLKESKLIGEADEQFKVFNPNNWSEIEKSKTSQYEAGLSIRFVRATSTFETGECVEVVAIEGNQLKVRKTSGQEVIFHPSRCPDKFQVGEVKEIPVSTGDKLLLRANSGDLINGQIVQVQGIINGEITLKDGRVIPPGYGMFTHGYAVTSPASQGKTVGEVFLVATTRSFPAVSQKQFYVSVSRVKDQVKVYTDDIEGLGLRVQALKARKSAVELAMEIPESGIFTKISQSRRQIAKTIITKAHRPCRSKRMNIFMKITTKAKEIRSWILEKLHKLHTEMAPIPTPLPVPISISPRKTTQTNTKIKQNTP